MHQRGRRSQRMAAEIADARARRASQRRWTLDELAARSTVSRRLIVQIEHAKANPSLATLLKLAAALGVPLTELLVGRAGDRPRSPSCSGRDAMTLWSTPAGRAARLLVSHGPLELWSWTLATRRPANQPAAPPRIARAAVRPYRHGQRSRSATPRGDPGRRQRLVRRDAPTRLREPGSHPRRLHARRTRARLTCVPRASKRSNATELAAFGAIRGRNGKAGRTRARCQNVIRPGRPPLPGGPRGPAPLDNASTRPMTFRRHETGGRSGLRCAPEPSAALHPPGRSMSECSTVEHGP